MVEGWHDKQKDRRAAASPKFDQVFRSGSHVSERCGPNGLVNLAHVGALFLAGAVLSLGAGLIRGSKALDYASLIRPAAAGLQSVSDVTGPAAACHPKASIALRLQREGRVSVRRRRPRVPKRSIEAYEGYECPVAAALSCDCGPTLRIACRGFRS